MAIDIFAKEKEEFVSELKRAGYVVEDDHGVVIAIAKADEYEEAKAKVKEIAKAAKYDLSYGVKKQKTLQ